MSNNADFHGAITQNNIVSSQRKSRRQAPIKTTGPLSQWRHLSNQWRQHFIDLGHCRIARCTQRLNEASESQRSELQSLELSFVALAISSAASNSGRARVQKEQDLKGYITAAIRLDLNVNDVHNGESAVELAAYHGLTEVLTQLLNDAGCPLKKGSLKRHAVFAAIINGQHDALEILLSLRTSEAIQVVNEEEEIEQRTGRSFSSLQEVIWKGDIVSAQLLLRYKCAVMSDRLAKTLYQPLNAKLRYHKKLESLLDQLYPEIPNVKHWSKELMWSFPTTDRKTINWLWHILHHRSNTEIIPSDMLLHVFSYFGRGWFASRRYREVGRSSADISQRNIIE
jgi:hypothetical protein